MIVLIVFTINLLVVLAWGTVLLKMINKGTNYTWNMLNWLSFFINLQTQTLLAILFTNILHCIFRRFKVLNTIFNNLNLTRRPIGYADEVHIVAVIGRYGTLHDELVDAVSAINKCYALPVRFNHVFSQSNGRMNEKSFRFL